MSTQMVEIPVDEIDLADRLREIDRDQVQILARSIEQVGLQAPVVVRAGRAGRFILIAGAHRLTACRMLGHATIAAIVTEADDLQAALMEVDENLCRHDLTALDRANFLAQRKRIYLKIHPETRAGGKRSKGKKISELDFALPPAFTADTAKRLDLSCRWIELSISISEKMTDEARRAASGTWVAKQARMLIEISRLAGPEQVPVVREMTKMVNPARNVAQAVERVFQRKKEVPDREVFQISQFARNWENSSQARRSSRLPRGGGGAAVWAAEGMREEVPGGTEGRSAAAARGGVVALAGARVAPAEGRAALGQEAGSTMAAGCAIRVRRS